MMRTSLVIITLSVLFLRVSSAAQRQGGPPAPPRTPRAAAPFDISGNWVSVVTEDWRWRMVVPKKGDYSGVPLTAEGRKVADSWDPSKMAGDGCKPYGAPALMRVPGRLKIAWENETTLKIETDAGQQTRLLRFETTLKPPATRTWQGQSVAEWQRIVQPGGQGVSVQQAAPRVGSLKVTKTSPVLIGYALTASAAPSLPRLSGRGELSEVSNRMTTGVARNWSAAGERRSGVPADKVAW